MSNIHGKSKTKATQQFEVILTGSSSAQNQQLVTATTSIEAPKTTEKTATTIVELLTTTTTTTTTTMEAPAKKVKALENKLKTSVVEQIKKITIRKNK